MSTEREDWVELVETAGWKRLMAALKERLAGEGYRQRIQVALSGQDRDVDAMSMREVGMAVTVADSVAFEVDQWMSFPRDRIRALQGRPE